MRMLLTAYRIFILRSYYSLFFFEDNKSNSSPNLWYDTLHFTQCDVSKKEIFYDIAYMQNLKSSDTNELIYKEKQAHRNWTYGYQEEGVEGRDS